VFNFRDLGGYPTTDGRHVRWRTLFRADALGRLTASDVEALRPFALRTVLDLRTRREIDERGRFPYERYPVTFHHLSVLDQTRDGEATSPDSLSAVDVLHRAYLTMLVDGADRFAAALSILAAPGALPAVFHCAAGKDRTGLLAALLLGALGVERSAIVADYALTADVMERFLDSYRRDPARARSIDAVPPAMLLAEPAAIDRLLDGVEHAHGSVRDYVRALGVEEDVLGRLSDAVLVESP
jgi:protein-tyrosine phosphatase